MKRVYELIGIARFLAADDYDDALRMFSEQPEEFIELAKLGSGKVEDWLLDCDVPGSDGVTVRQIFADLAEAERTPGTQEYLAAREREGQARLFAEVTPPAPLSDRPVLWQKLLRDDRDLEKALEDQKPGSGVNPDSC